MRAKKQVRIIEVQAAVIMGKPIPGWQVVPASGGYKPNEKKPQVWLQRAKAVRSAEQRGWEIVS